MEIVLMVAVADNGVIGAAGSIPWRLKSDQQRLKTMTMGKPVVMGRKTFISLRRPLPGRTNIVVTRDTAFAARGVISAPSLEAALTVARGDAYRRGVCRIMIIGGADLYSQTIGHARRLEITRVHARPAGDSTFPAIDPAQWRETERCEYPAGPDDDAAFTTLSYESTLA
jgi:dihydrofolate reductase